jgi:ubiquinone/menaquinone biosynthesis C-methylase UbiE
MTPDPMQCLLESKRVLQDGGVLVCSSWQSSQWIEVMKIPGCVRPGLQQPSVPIEWATAPALKAELEKAGFQDVEAKEVEVTMEFDTYDAVLKVLFEVMPHMVNLLKDFSEEERAKVMELAREKVEMYSPNEPGSMKGVALVAAGRKGGQ